MFVCVGRTFLLPIIKATHKLVCVTSCVRQFVCNMGARPGAYFLRLYDVEDVA